MRAWKAVKIWDNDCWIFGGGFSIIRELKLSKKLAPIKKEEFIAFGDLIKHHFVDKKVIGVNNAFMLGNWIDVAFWGDKSQYINYQKQYNEFSGLKVTADQKFNYTPNLRIKCIKRNTRRMIGLSKSNKSVSWNKCSGTSAINLAMHFGAKRIFLLGFDMHNDEETGRTHWHGGYPDRRLTPTSSDLKKGKKVTIRKVTKEWTPPHSKFLKAFDIVAKYADKYGLEIINCSPDSKITQFPKKSILECLKL